MTTKKRNIKRTRQQEDKTAEVFAEAVHRAERRDIFNRRKGQQCILDDAKSKVYGDRAAEYGHPQDNFANIAGLWNAYLKIKENPFSGEAAQLTNIDIANLNILQKVARLATNQTHIDSIVDIAGYAATIERIVRKV